MKRFTKYFWRAYLVVMRWVKVAIATAVPARTTMTQPEGPTEDSPSVKDVEEVQDRRQTIDVETAIPPLPQLSEEPSEGRRMATAWAHRCRLLSVDKNTDLQTAAQRLLTRPAYGGLLVIDNESNDVIGILHERDLVRALGEYGAGAGYMRVGQLVKP